MNMTRLGIKVAKLWLIAMGVMTGVVSHAEQQAVNQRLDAQPDGFVHVNVVRGEIQIQGWDKSQVEVRGVLDEEVKEFIFSVDGSETTIRVKIPRNSHGGWFNKEETELVIRVPENSQIKFAGVSTDIRVYDVKAGIEIGVISGDLKIKGGAGRIILQTVSGEIELRDASGRIRVKTVSGDVESYNTSGSGRYGSVSGSLFVEDGGEELELESVSGDIEVSRTEFLSISGHSVSGDTDIRGNMLQGGSIDFDNVSGSIRLKFTGDVNSRFDLETGSGSIRNRLTKDKPKASKYVRDKRLRFVIGDGDGEVILSTRSGDITLSN